MKGIINSTLKLAGFCAAVGFFFSTPLAYSSPDHDHGHGHGHEEQEHEEEKKGPHGGKIFRQDDFAVELTIFEQNQPPQFRVYAFHDEEPVSPEQVTVTITLERFKRPREIFELSAADDYLTSNQEVTEPHSFDATIIATFADNRFSWEFSSHEGRTELSKTALKVADLSISTVEAKEIHNTARVYGRLLPNENKVAHIVPRFPGIVTEIKKALGDAVEKGELLAVVQSNQSLQPYEIRSQVAGVVIKRHATLGEFVSDTREIFIVADLSEVWADFQVYRDDFGPIEIGQTISIEFGDGQNADAKISYIAPVLDEATQSKLIRAVLSNPSGSLRPGLFISGEISSTKTNVPMAVTRQAVQKFRDWDVVYITDGHTFQAMPVELGRRDGKHIEVISGLQVGDKYVSEKSFIIKADIEKSGASHDH